MKHIYNRCLILFLGAVCFTLTGCDYADGEGSGSDNAVYMNTPENKGVMQFVLSATGGTIAVGPRLADITDQDVTVRMEYDKSVVEKYNKDNGTRYEALPVSAFSLIAGEKEEASGAIDLTVTKGNYTAQATLKVGKLDETEFPVSTKYAIPFSITSTSAYGIIPSRRTVIIILNRPLLTSVACLSGGGIVITPTKEWSVPEWTIQMSALYSTLNRSNLTTAFINSWAGSEFYTRINATQGIQVKNGSDGEGNATWTAIPLQPKKWLHMAFVHKDNTVTVYVNGKVQRVFPTGAIWLTARSSIQVGNGGYDHDYVREIRYWSKALTEAEINDNLYLPLSPDTPHLEAYLPLTIKTGTKDLIAPPAVDGKSNVTVSGTITWQDNVKFPADDLEIVEK